MVKYSELLFLCCLFMGNTRLTLGELLETELINRLIDPSVYSKRERPGRLQGIPTIVNLAIYINSIGSISEITMDFTVTMFLRQIWKDHRLAYDNISGIEFDVMTLNYEYASEIWQPDIYIKNERSLGTKHEISVPNIMLTLSSDGTVFYSQRISTTLGCMMRLYRYPLDHQTCEIALESYGYSTEDIVVKWYNVTEPLSIAPDLELPEFYLASNKVRDCTQYYTTGNQTGSWSCVAANFIMRRMFEYYMIQVYVPSIMIVILSWVSFWIDIHAVPARVSLGLLTVLTMTTQSSGISGKLPRVSYIKAIDVWMFTCMTFVFGGLIEYSAVNVLARRSTYNKYSMTRKNTIATIDMEKVVDEEETTENRKCRSLGTCGCNLSLWWRRQTRNKAVLTDMISRVLFPFSFLFFNIIYWGYYYFYPKYKDEL